MKLTNSKHIVISNENYEALKDLGRAGESFNLVISRLLKKGIEN